MEVSTNILRGIASVLRDRDISTATLLHEAGVDTNLLERAQPSTNIDVASRVIQAALRLSKDPSLALQLGTRAPMQALGAFGELLIHSPTIRAAISEAQVYIPLVLPLSRLRLLEEGERAHLIFEPSFSEPGAQRFASEMGLAFGVRVGRHFVGRHATPIEVRMRHPVPRYAEMYEQTFGCPVRFEAPRYEIVFARSLLEARQPFPDDTLWRVIKQRADDLLVQERAREQLHERVRHVLRHEADLGSVNPTIIARRLGVSPRSLRRRLGDEGHSLSALADEVRRELALSALLNPEMPIKRIADRVGFSEVSAFHRAFKRWTGETPARYRSQTGLAHAS